MKTRTSDRPLDGDEGDRLFTGDRPSNLRSYEPDEIRRWLREMCALAGLSPTKLAQAADIAPSTINKFLNDPEVKHRPSTRTLLKVEQAASRAFVERTRDLSPEQRLAERFVVSAEFVPPEPERHTRTLYVEVRGAVEEGKWYEADDMEWPPNRIYRIHVPPDPRAPEFGTFALEVRGPAMDLLYPEGTVLVCAELEEEPESLKDGVRVIVQRADEKNRLEVTAKELRRDERGEIWLWPRSKHPAHQQPVPLHSDSARAKIIGQVIGSYRPE